MLAGASTGVRADIDETDEGLRGGAARKDVEKMFQLIYLTFTAPRADPAQFEALKTRLRPMLANQQARPETAFREALVSALTQDHPRARPLTAASVDQMSLERSMAFYKSRFADASDFTFVFVGSFDVAAMKPLVERYLASLPSIQRVEAAVDRGVHPPAGVVERQVVKGVDPRSQVAIVFSGPFQNDQMHRLLVKTMSQMLAGNLHRTLREDLGGTYGVSVESQFSKYPTAEYQISIGFSCDPARVDDLTAAAWKVIRDFTQQGPSRDQLAGCPQCDRTRARGRLSGKCRPAERDDDQGRIRRGRRRCLQHAAVLRPVDDGEPARCRTRLPERAAVRAGDPPP